MNLHPLDDYVRQQLSRSADKGSSLLVFFLPRPLADKYERRVRIALSEDDVLPTFVQFTAGAISKLFADSCKFTGLGYRRLFYSLA